MTKQHYWYALGAIVTLLGCQTATQQDARVFPKTTFVPIEKPLEQRTTLTGTEQSAGLKQGAPAPFDGILLSERLAIKYKLIQQERDRLRVQLQIERDLHIGRFEQCNKVATTAIRATTPNWWQQYKGWVGFLGGYVASTATVIAAMLLVIGVN